MFFLKFVNKSNKIGKLFINFGFLWILFKNVSYFWSGKNNSLSFFLLRANNLKSSFFIILNDQFFWTFFLWISHFYWIFPKFNIFQFSNIQPSKIRNFHSVCKKKKLRLRSCPEVFENIVYIEFVVQFMHLIKHFFVFLIKIIEKILQI